MWKGEVATSRVEAGDLKIYRLEVQSGDMGESVFYGEIEVNVDIDCMMF